MMSMTRKGESVLYPWKPVKTVGGVDKVQVTVWEQSSIKWARVASHENGREPIFPVLPKQLLELWEGLEDWIEVICWKIIEVHPELCGVVHDPVAYALDGLKDIFDDW